MLQNVLFADINKQHKHITYRNFEHNIFVHYNDQILRPLTSRRSTLTTPTSSTTSSSATTTSS
eukprot:3296461-Amphidinium_carterae.1